MEVDDSQSQNQVVKENAALVQPDWDMALKEMPRPQFFVGLRKHGEKSVFANVEKEGDDLICADPSIRVSVQLTCNSLHVESTNINTIFLSPVSDIRDLHDSAIQSMDISCTGNLIVSSDISGNLIISNVMNGSLLRVLKGHIMDVYKCRFFPSGLVVLSAGMDMSVRVWSVETGQCPRIFRGHTMAVTDIAIIGVGREVLSCSNDGAVIKWLCADGSQQELWRLEAGPCNAIALDQKSEIFAVACEGKKCIVCSVEGPIKVTIATDNIPTAVCIDHDLENIIYVGDEQGVVSVYDMKLRSYTYHLQTNRGSVMKMMTRDEGLFVAFKDGSMCCYLRQYPPPSDVTSPLYEFTGSDCDPIYDFCFHNKHLFTASRDRVPLVDMLKIHRCVEICAARLQKQQIRFKTVKFKPKIAKNRPLKTPSAVALDHCDFYYGPMFGKRWPSIRLGLLTPNKYIAVMNTFSKSCDAHEDILKDLSTLDLLARIRGKTAAERIEEKKLRVESLAKEDTERAMREMNDHETAQPTSSQDDPDLIMRSAAGLGEFQPPSGSVTPGELQLGKKKQKKENLENFEVTGFEAEGMELARRNHFIYYPRELRLRCYDRGILSDFPPPVKDDTGIPSWWLLDGGSLVPVLALGLEKGDSLLDVCAAPGGKSLLALLTKLPGKMVCNDFKLARLGQLKRALSIYVPPNAPEANTVILKRKDASNLATWDELNTYDKVIADVPCSTDRLALNQDEGNMYSPQMTNERLNLPQLQTKILINALRSVKVGGSVVYSTCTLSSIQNEAVVENGVAIAEQKFGVRVVEESLEQLVTHLSSSGLYRFSDQCRTGALVLPFIPSNFGPMYVCKLTRLA